MANSLETAQKRFSVSFCIHDYYSTTLSADDALQAIAKAQALYDTVHEDAFDFDISRGGTDEWTALEVVQ